MAVPPSPRSVLVAGGLGFVGAHFVNLAFDRWPDARLIVLDRLSNGANLRRLHVEVRQSERFRLVIGDVINRQLVQSLLTEQQVCGSHQKSIISRLTVSCIR